MPIRIRYKLTKLWKFIWENDSPLSWLLNIVIAFIIVKFIIYPGLGFVLGTTHPVVAVVSGSMSHNLENFEICGSNPKDYDSSFSAYWEICGKWYANNNINKQDAYNWKFRNGFNKGDIMILKGSNSKDINVGDVIVFRSFLPDPIIHRVVRKIEIGTDFTFETKGDHNQDQILIHGETEITSERIVGKAVFRIPYLGWIKILAVDIFESIKKVSVGG